VSLVAAEEQLAPGGMSRLMMFMVQNHSLGEGIAFTVAVLASMVNDLVEFIRMDY